MRDPESHLRVGWSPEQNQFLRNLDFSLAAFSAAFPDDDHSPEAIYRQRRRLLNAPPTHQTRRMSPSSGEDVGSQTVKTVSSDELLDEQWTAWERAFDRRIAGSPTQEATEFESPADGFPIGVMFTGDWHIGAGGFDPRLLRHDLTILAETPGLYGIGMGDYVEGVGVKNKAAPALYEGESNDGDTQEAHAIRAASWAAGKWLALMAGNHDEWIRSGSGLSRTPRIFAPLGCPVFGQGGGTVFANVGGERYVLAVSHRGIRGGGSALNTSNAQRRTFDAWPEWENCDVICLGHYHFNDLHIPPRKGGRCVYLRSGTYKTYDSYAADGGHRPEHGTPMVILYPDKKKIRAFRGDELEDGIAELKRIRGEYRAHLSTLRPVA